MYMIERQAVDNDWKCYTNKTSL